MCICFLWTPHPVPPKKVCLLTELKPLVFSEEVLSEVLMLAAVQEHVQSAACVLYQVSESLHVDTRVIKTWNITPSPSVSFVCVINDKMTKASNKNEYASPPPNPRPRPRPSPTDPALGAKQCLPLVGEGPKFFASAVHRCEGLSYEHTKRGVHSWLCFAFTQATRDPNFHQPPAWYLTYTQVHR